MIALHPGFLVVTLVSTDYTLQGYFVQIEEV